MDYNEFIRDNTIELNAGHRGGVIKVDVSSLFDTGDEEAVMGASQNYLGGGMRGCISGGSMFDPTTLSEKEQTVFKELDKAIKRYFHAITNSEENDMNDEWNTMDFEKTQNMPNSAY